MILLIVVKILTSLDPNFSSGRNARRIAHNRKAL